MKNIVKTMIVFFLFILFSGCANIPNYKSPNASAINPAKFKYGKYCGKGHPTFSSVPGSEKRTQDLKTIWPPSDDVDLICYAHDMCYQLVGSLDLMCDHAMIATTHIHSKNFNEESGCSNLTKFAGSGLSAKFWELRNDGSFPFCQYRWDTFLK